MRNPSNARAWDKCAPSIRLAGILALAIAAASATVRAQDGKEWVGKRVILQPESVLRVGNQVVDNGRTRGRIYRVEQVEGPWLWIKAEQEGVTGWIKAAEVIRHDQAIDYFTNLIRTNPANLSAYIRRGHIWGDKKEYDIALGDYNEAIRLDPASEVAWDSRGITWYAKREYDKAVADFGEAIRLDRKYANAYNWRGKTWSAKKEYDKAVADFGEAIRLDPKFASAYNNRAWLWATCPDVKHRNGKRAIESATKACELSEWKDANRIDTLAAAHAEAGDFAKAVEFQTKANTMYDDAEAKKEGEAHLKLYQDRTPYREVKP